jgi:hypothetical protein
VVVLGWVVLTLVFVDEVLAVVAAGVVGYAAAGVVGAVLAPAVAVVVWWTFASPKAPRGGPVARPVAKVLVFGSACLGLWSFGHPGWAIALLVFSVVVNGLAQLRFVRDLMPEPTR